MLIRTPTGCKLWCKAHACSRGWHLLRKTLGRQSKKQEKRGNCWTKRRPGWTPTTGFCLPQYSWPKQFGVRLIRACFRRGQLLRNSQRPTMPISYEALSGFKTVESNDVDTLRGTTFILRRRSGRVRLLQIALLEIVAQRRLSEIRVAIRVS